MVVAFVFIQANYLDIEHVLRNFAVFLRCDTPDDDVKLNVELTFTKDVDVRLPMSLTHGTK